jgi:L-arabinonolactonase
VSDVQVSCVVDSKNMLGEGALWCPREQVLWWIDIVNPSLWCFVPRAGQVTHWPLPKRPGSFALRQDQGFLFAFQRGFATLEAPGGEPHWREIPGLALGDERFNDGKCDRAGRFWAGTLDRQVANPIGALYRLDAKFQLVTLDRGFTVSNGIGWSPDDRFMYFTDTPARRIYRYDFDPGSGAITNRRVLVEVEPGHGGPDGLTVDTQGYLWSAQFDRWCVHRYAPDGRLDRIVRMPMQRPTACMFGGPDLATLYVTSARVGIGADALDAQPQAGGVFAFDPGVRGLPEPRFAA